MQLITTKLIFDSIVYALQSAWEIYLTIAIILLLKLVWLLYRRHRLMKAGMPEIDHMTGDEFKRRLGLLFEKRGYRVEYVGSHRGDYGADLVLEKDNVRTVVQAKRHAHYIDGGAVKEAYTARNMYNATRAMVVTNNYFSRPAKVLAKTNDVELWDREELAKRIVGEE